MKNAGRWSKKHRNFIARNINQEGMQKTARGRRTRLERLLKEKSRLSGGRQIRQKPSIFRFKPSDVKSDIVLRAENVSKSFGDLTLF